MAELTLTTTKIIDAPVERVFDAWLDPEMLAKFMIPGDGMTVSKVETDAQVGGRFTIVMVSGEKEMPHAGTYLEIEPHSKLSFTWEAPWSAEGSSVEILFKRIGDAKTEIQLTHVKFSDEESRDSHLGGWNAILRKLAEIL